MCLIAFSIGASSRWPLVIASNRDEFFDRPTLPLDRWATPEGQVVVSGRDVLAGGTWLGLSPEGRVAMLTNVREPGMAAGPRSRGELTLAWLGSRDDAQGFLARIDAEAYSGFNLVVGDMAQRVWHWASNRVQTPAGMTLGWQQRELPPGVYGLSNAFLDTPWPKTRKLSQTLTHALQDTSDVAEALWPALADRSLPSDEELPRTGVPLDLERQLGSAFVHMGERGYGTRTSTLVLAQPYGGGLQVSVQERTHLPTGAQARRLELDWPARAAVD